MSWIEWTLALTLAVWLAPGVAGAQERTYDWGWSMHPMWGLWEIWGVGMMLFMFLFWALVIVGIVAAIRWVIRQGRPAGADTALEILRERYARGEINRDEFEARRRDLER